MHRLGKAVGRGGRVAAALAVGAILGLGCSGGEEAQAPPAGQAAAPPLADAQATAKRLEEALAKLPPEALEPKARERVKPKYIPKNPPEIEERVLAVRRVDEDAPDAFDRVLAALKDEHEAVRSEALGILEDIAGDHPESQERAIRTAGDVLAKDASEAVRLRAVEALDYLRSRAASDQLVRGLGDESADVREAVVEALAFRADPDHLPALEAALGKEGDREVKADLSDAIASLRRQKERGKQETPETAEKKAEPEAKQEPKAAPEADPTPEI